MLNNGELICFSRQVGRAGQQPDHADPPSWRSRSRTNLKSTPTCCKTPHSCRPISGGQVESDLNQLRNIVSAGTGHRLLDGQYRRRAEAALPELQRLQNQPAEQCASFSSSYQSVVHDQPRHDRAARCAAAGLTADQFSSEDRRWSQLRSQSESADGQMKALQVGHQIAAQEVAQMQKLRGLVSQQMTMMATWYQSSNRKKTYRPGAAARNSSIRRRRRRRRTGDAAEMVSRLASIIAICVAAAAAVLAHLGFRRPARCERGTRGTRDGGFSRRRRNTT